MKKYLYKEAQESSLEYFNGDQLAATVFVDKYALRDNENNLLEKNPNEMHKRLSKEFARIEKKYPNPMDEEEIFNLFKNFKYICPQGSPMSTIGNEYKIQTAGNCYVIDSPYDSYSGILYSDQQMAQLMKRRAGVGIDISNIRPKGMLVKNAAKTTDGISVFMERYSNTCREVAQNGRRGANIQTIAINHPDIETFIDIKKDRKKVTGSNISVRVSDDFMKAVENDSDFELKWPVDSDNPKLSKKVKAKRIWEKIVHNAWENAEPGVMFWDTMNDYSPAHVYGAKDNLFYNRTCNPCGEIVMGVDSCRLMVLNLYSFVKNPFTENSVFNYEEFGRIVQKAQRLMDDLVDIETELIEKIINKIQSDKEPEDIKKIEIDMWKNYLKICQIGRRTGLGITGLGDTLASLNLHYGSKESIEETEKIYKQLCLNSYISSCIMAKERGAFPIYDYDLEKDNKFLRRIFNENNEIEKMHKETGRRNIALLTTAPTGSVSILTQTSSGIEPVFELSYTRRKKIHDANQDIKVDFIDELGDKWQEYTVYHHKFKKWMEISNKTNVEDSPYYQSTANEIDWVNSVEIQSVAQKWICHSISKTCNLPNNIDEETVSQIYMKAWKTGCKGLTIYRDGCRDGVLIRDKNEENRSPFIIENHSPKRPKTLLCDVNHLSYKYQKYYVIVGLLENKPYEIFTGINYDSDGNMIISQNIKDGQVIKKSRGNYALIHFDKNNDECEIQLTNNHYNDTADALTRSISMCLRHGVDISYIVSSLEKTRGELMCFSKVLGRTIKKYIKDGTKVSGTTCPQCKNEKLHRIDGCISCPNCGWGGCG